VRRDLTDSTETITPETIKVWKNSDKKEELTLVKSKDAGWIEKPSEELHTYPPKPKRKPVLFSQLQDTPFAQGFKEIINPSKTNSSDNSADLSSTVKE
jgi:hypothetical protein